MRTPSLALRKAREMRRLKDPAASDGVHIVLLGGVYPMSAPLVVRQEDSGDLDHPTVFRAAEGQRPVLSGGLTIRGWRKLEERTPALGADAQAHVMVAQTPSFQGRPLEFRQLWVNGRKAVRAQSPNPPEMARLTRWDREAQQAGIPKHLAGPYSDPRDLEMTVLQMWEIAKLRVRSVQVEREDATVRFHAPESAIEFQHPWPQPVMGDHGAPFYLSGALELLDQPGEWHLDRGAGRLYYWPREDDDLSSAEVVAPAIETLVQVSGTVDRPVRHIEFRGIRFQHTTWLRPSTHGHVPLQAGMYLTEAYKLRPKGTPEWRSLDNQAWVGRPPAAVQVEGAQHVDFEGCRFEHIASAGLDFVSATSDDRVEGCLFRDVGGNGIQLGGFQAGAIETHLPYGPQDERQVCQRERIANNLVADCANEDWGCVGIGVGYAREVEVVHNEVTDCSYTGISLGWGWTRDKNALRDNRVAANHIHHIATRMADTAGVYTLSAQPGTVIERNHIHDIQMSPYVHDPEHWFYLYLDEGSSLITVRDNWVPAGKFLENAVGPGNVWENNGPDVDESVRREAGMEGKYQRMLQR